MAIRVYQHSPTVINALPSNLYGADWLQINQKQIDEPVSVFVNEDMDVFIGYKKSALIAEPNKMSGNTNTEIVTDEKGGTVYEVFKQRYKKNSEVMLNVNEQNIIAFLPVNNMQPAYDLKPIVQYKTNVVKLSEGAGKDSPTEDIVQFLKLIMKLVSNILFKSGQPTFIPSL